MPYIQRTTVITTSSTDRGYGAWCMSRLAVLKWIQIILCAIIIILIGSGRACWAAYQYIFVLSIVCLILTAVTMLLYFLRLHVRLLPDLPWYRIEFGWNIVAAIGFLIAFILCVWDCVKLYDNYDISHHDYFCYGSGSLTGWRNKITAITVMTGLNAILYLSSGMHVNHFAIL